MGKGLRVSKNTYTFASLLKRNTYIKHWKGGRVVDYSGLENRRAERHRGFESLPFRRERATKVVRFFVPKKMHQKCTKPRCYALLRVFYKSQISHTVYPVRFLYVMVARRLKTTTNTPSAAKLCHISAKVVPFKYTARIISI